MKHQREAGEQPGRPASAAKRKLQDRSDRVPSPAADQSASVRRLSNAAAEASGRPTGASSRPQDRLLPQRPSRPSAEQVFDDRTLRQRLSDGRLPPNFVENILAALEGGDETSPSTSSAQTLRRAEDVIETLRRQQAGGVGPLKDPIVKEFRRPPELSQQPNERQSDSTDRRRHAIEQLKTLLNADSDLVNSNRPLGNHLAYLIELKTPCVSLTTRHAELERTCDLCYDA